MSRYATALVLSEKDYRNLSALIAANPTPATELLEEELGRAEVLPEETVPPGVVAMHSLVSLTEPGGKAGRKLTLVYPREADISQGKISVLAPMGMALIGLREGQRYRWPMPNGREREFVVATVAAATEGIARDEE